jgi:GT2 family glycosyltransferase
LARRINIPLPKIPQSSTVAAEGYGSFTEIGACGDIPVSARSEVDLSVCVCTANRADDLSFALESLAHLRVPPGRNVEFIFVDNASTDATPVVLSAAATWFPFPVIILNEPVRGLASARNCALHHARGEIVVWTDDDCVPAEDWIECILAHFDEDPALDLLTGRVELYDQSHYPITINTSLEPAIIDEISAYDNLVLGANLAFRRQLLEQIGFFDSRFGAGSPLLAGEDTDFAFRALRGGYRIAYAPDVLLYHNHKRVTHDQVTRLRRNYTYANGALLMKHVVAGDSMAARWFYWQLLGSFGRVLRPPSWIPGRTDNVRFLLVFLAGAFAYLCCAARRPSGPIRGRGSRAFRSAS